MVFQDFDQISERRKAERQRKLRKMITIAALSSIILLGLIGGAAFGFLRLVRDGKKKSPEEPGGKQVSHVEKVVKMVCNATDYQRKCVDTLTKARQTNPNLSQPNNLLKTAISAAAGEFDKASNTTTSFSFSTEEEKGAFEDCKQLFGDAMEELEETISKVKLSARSSDLNNWLSAVMSYQQTCIDGFPDGQMKKDMEKALQDVKEYTSNALALVSEVASYVYKNKTFKEVGASPRHLLAATDVEDQYYSSNSDQTSNGGLPSWMSHEDRRMLKANDKKATPNVTVAKDDSGNYKTISEALAAIPPKYEGRYVIYIKEGTYEETIIVSKKMVNITMYGDGSQKTIITGSKNHADGVRTFQTATFAALGERFIAKSMGFRNTAGPEKHEAVAARVQADRSIFLNCRFEGYHNTLYTQTHRQFYRSCVIAGTVDFIFGDAAAMFQNSLIFVRKPLDNQQNIVTAQGRIDKHETTGIVLQNCRIEPDKDLEPVKSQIKSYLGRPWKEYSRTIVMESTIEDFIHSDGWLQWEGEFALNTLYYAEYNNKGPGANLDYRVKWPGYKGALAKEDAIKFTVVPFLQGNRWIRDAGVPLRVGLYA